MKPGVFLVINWYTAPWPQDQFTEVAVFAGADRFPGGAYGPESQPPVPSILVRLETSTTACRTDVHDVGHYALPGATSPLHIVSVDGTVINLGTDDGRQYRFDLRRRTWM